MEVMGARWRPASPWWGKGRDGVPIELDIVAEGEGDRVLVGECTLRLDPGAVAPMLKSIQAKAEACPPLAGRQIVPTLWLVEGEAQDGVVRAADVLA